MNHDRPRKESSCSLRSFPIPDRGPWGSARYRGNCSGYLIRDLLQEYEPASFLEIFAGGGTGRDVARDLGYDRSVHLDLNPAWGGFECRLR